MKLLNDKQEKFLLDHYKGISNADLTVLINKEFKTSFSIKQIRGYKNNRHLNSGLTGYFVKGQKSWNKGKKWDDFMSKESQKNSRTTTFKKGNTPFNSVPIGTELWKNAHNSRNDKGFLYVKIQDKKGRFNWKEKHRIIWEENYGPIPKGYKVIFKDGNRTNFNIENLALVSNSQMLILNKRDLIYKDKELTESGIIVAKLLDEINGKSKKRL